MEESYAGVKKYLRVRYVMPYSHLFQLQQLTALNEECGSQQAGVTEDSALHEYLR
jgi:hypothetical protein